MPEITKKPPTHLETIHKNLGALLESKAAALPTDFNQTRFMQNCMTVLQDTKDIQKMQPLSIARTLLKGAFLGLDFLNKECYAIPYNNNLNFQTDYKGEIKLAKRYSSSKIRDIYAKLAREGDELTIRVEDGKQLLNFTPLPFNDGAIQGAFAVCLFEDGSMLYETMSEKEILDTRKNYSKAPNSKAWEKSSGEMYKKTVLRRLCKLIDLNFDTQEQIKAFDEGGDATFVEPKTVTTIEMPRAKLSAPKPEEVYDAQEETEEEPDYSIAEPEIAGDEIFTEEPIQDDEVSIINCTSCNAPVNEKVAKFSKSKFGLTLCFNCQKPYKGKDNGKA